MQNLKLILTFLNSSYETLDTETINNFNQPVDKLDSIQIQELHLYLNSLYQKNPISKVCLPLESLHLFIQETAKGQNDTYFVWTLYWLLSLEIVNPRLRLFVNPKINKLFMQLVDNNLEQARKCYAQFSKHQALQGKQFLLEETKVQPLNPYDINNKITTALTLQKDNPLGIVPICPALFGLPQKFAPVVIWMLDNGVSEDALIETGLLSLFLAHNINLIEMQDNPVKQFYALLDTHYSEKTKQLLIKAKQTLAYSECLPSWSF